MVSFPKFYLGDFVKALEAGRMMVKHLFNSLSIKALTSKYAEIPHASSKAVFNSSAINHQNTPTRVLEQTYTPEVQHSPIKKMMIGRLFPLWKAK